MQKVTVLLCLSVKLVLACQVPFGLKRTIKRKTLINEGILNALPPTSTPQYLHNKHFMAETVSTANKLFRQ